MTLRNVLIIIQALSFVGLAAVLCCSGEWKLGVAQAFLAIITVLVYTA